MTKINCLNEHLIPETAIRENNFILINFIAQRLLFHCSRDLKECFVLFYLGINLKG